MVDVVEVKTIIICLILLLATTVMAGERRNIKVYDSGKKTAGGHIIYEHFTLLDVGECNEDECVISEGITEQWDGGKWIHQLIDTNSDGGCDIIKVWKPMVDATYGTYYSIFTIKLCGGVI
jgi:hypothetical protein